MNARQAKEIRLGILTSRDLITLMISLRTTGRLFMFDVLELAGDLGLSRLARRALLTHYERQLVKVNR